MAGEVTGCFHPVTTGICFAEGTDGKAEKSGEEKNDKEYMPGVSLQTPAISSVQAYGCYAADPAMSPDLGCLTPPPDSTTVFPRIAMR